MQGPARGYPLWTCFLQFFKRGLKRKQLFWKKGIFGNLSRFALFVLWRSIQSQFKKDQPLFKIKEKNCFEEGKIIEFVKVWFLCAFEKHSMTIQNHSTTIQKVIFFLSRFFGSILNLNYPFCNLVFGNLKNLDSFWKLFAAIAGAPPFLHMPW